MDGDHQQWKEEKIRGRYLTLEDLQPFLDKISGQGAMVKVVGQSVEERDIFSVQLGHGDTKILMWSQMHGNESTTTKAVLDLMNFLLGGSEEAQRYLGHFSLLILPMLNPDGAYHYTRVNAAGIDLNRDAKERTQAESIALRNVFDEFQPDYCFNLHDQRTIFSVGQTPKPATVSFLAPAHDVERSISTSRATSMRLIVAMTQQLEQLIPGQIGRYDDAFNPNCTGDSFQMTGTPTVLFESGHFPGDYQREKTREYIWIALMTALQEIAAHSLEEYSLKDYERIPENGKCFVDILVKNAHLWDADLAVGAQLPFQYKEVLEAGKIELKPSRKLGLGVTPLYGHTEYDCSQPHELDQLRQRMDLKGI